MAKIVPVGERRRAPQEKRELLLQAAQALFKEQGFEQTSTVQIARRAGVSEGILFHHFGSKRGLFDCMVADFLQAGAEAVMPEDPAQLTEEQVVRAAFDFSDQHPALHKMLIQVTAELGESQSTSTSTVMINAIEARLQAGMRQHKIRQGNPRIMAELQFAVVDAAYRAWQNSADPSLREDYIEEAVSCMKAMLSPV